MKKVILILIVTLLYSCVSFKEEVILDSYNDIVVYKTDEVVIKDFFYEKSKDLYIWILNVFERESFLWIPDVIVWIKCPPEDIRKKIEENNIRLEVTITYNKKINEVIFLSPAWITTDKKNIPIEMIDLSSDVIGCEI